MTLVSIATQPTLSPLQKFGISICQFTAPATVAYAAGDVISDSAGTAKALAFPNMGVVGAITNAVILTSSDATTSTLDLLLFEVEPPNFADNAAAGSADFSGLLDACIGTISFTQAGKVLESVTAAVWRATDAANTLWCAPMNYAVRTGTNGGLLYGLLYTRGANTFTAGTQFTIKLYSERLT